MTEERPDRLRSGPRRFHDDDQHYQDAEFDRAHGVMEDALAAWEDQADAVPIWADSHIRDWQGRLRELLNLVHAASHALHLMPEMPFILELIHAASEPANDEDARHRASEMRDVVQSAGQAVELAKDEFRLLFILATVWTWTSLEALIEDLVVQAVANAAPSDIAPRLKGLKVPGEIALIKDPEELAKALYREWEARNAMAEGATRFEAILGLAGLDGGVPADVRRDVFELGQVRNVLLHRGGAADAAFIEACPWVGAVSGSPLEVTHHKFEEYAYAVMHYVAIIRLRIVAIYPPHREASTDKDTESIGTD